MSFNKRKKKKNKLPTNVLVDSVLNPKAFFGSKTSAKSKQLFRFVISATDDEFERAIDTILNDKEMYSFLQSTSQISEMHTKPFIDYSEITTFRALRFYRSIISKRIEDISFFQKTKIEVESLFVRGAYEQVLELIEDIDNKIGSSLWSINIKFATYSASKQYSKINEYLEWLKNENNSNLFQELVRVIAWKSQSFDSDLIIENMVRRPNKEFIEGGALDIAAFYSLLLLPYPLFDDVNLGYSIKWLQHLTIIDTYEALIKISNCIVQDENLDIRLRNELCETFSMFDRFENKRIKNLIHTLKTNNHPEYNLQIDEEIDNYTKGNYVDVISSLEGNFRYDDNLIAKVNIYAKSYIYLDKTPNNLPSFISDVVNNLIKIYSLVDANQSVSLLKNLAIRYSSLEISEHLVISIDKSAPYFFNNIQKQKLKSSSFFLSLPLTPLACNTKQRPALYISNLDTNSPRHILLKNKAIKSLLSNNENTLEHIDDFYNSTKITKDAIEIKVEYFLMNDDIDGLILYSANEMIDNHNSCLCLPLSVLIKYIDENCIYTLDSVICAYYYNYFSNDDESSILNEVFEEFILTLDINRPSEMIRNGLSKKEIFFLQDISKPEVMDYLGCFKDNNDLKIERISILNKLVDHKYMSQTEIDKECKDIVDDMLLESEAAKFNNAKIFVDTKFIIEKRKDDISSILKQLYSTSNTQEPDIESLSKIESMTVPKGKKNEVVTRVISMLLVEFMNNKEVGLDINLSSEIRHGFFSNLMCSKLQHRNLITELNEKGAHKSNSYWIDYYSMVNQSIIDDIDGLLIKFSHDFNKLIEVAEEWMKVSLNGHEKERLFTFSLKIEDFEKVRNFINKNTEPSDVCELMFSIFNTKLSACMSTLKSKLNEEFVVKIDELFSKLIDDITRSKKGTSLSDLLSEIRLANTEVKEDIRTVCEWFSFKKPVEFESFEIKKSILLAERCFKQINNCNINININTNEEITIEGSHLYPLVFTYINCFNNSFKYSCEHKDIDIVINKRAKETFSITITNAISYASKKSLESGVLNIVRSNLLTMENHDLLTTEGGSGLYKSLHGLRKESKRYNLLPSVTGNNFCVELTYE